MIHEIAMDAGLFADIAAGRKSHIMQKDTDAQYQVGDFLALNETVDDHGPDGDAVNWTGRCCLVSVVNISYPAERYARRGTIVLDIRPCGIMGGALLYDPAAFTVPVYGAPGGGSE